jgi:hypothetical protein
VRNVSCIWKEKNSKTKKQKEGRQLIFFYNVDVVYGIFTYLEGDNSSSSSSGGG